ncbi:cobalamin biosynthesis protein CobG [Pseudaestuariivita atlantica]|uniref:cobalamin biosynthesis protein CobG n=1 Tax=Pseudaestuariivita atlantica TaxID=1317121 RepID=UPI000ACDF457|nr:cobalamin biosynthesis protein CobG [Pseudaestuariivita atlantica]
MTAKGWCPGVLRPMEVEDGLLVRVKPPMSRLSPEQARAICDAAEACGSGALELTSRANLQIRGVTEATHADLVARLDAVGLVDPDKVTEARRQITVTPLWSPGAETEALHDRIVAGLGRLPDLPEKLGIAVDTGRAAVLRDASADFRFERVDDGILLRADGVEAGRLVTLDTAVDHLVALAEWFAANKTDGVRRMADLTATTEPPEDWRAEPMAHRAGGLVPGTLPNGCVIGVPGGALTAERLRGLLDEASPHGLRLMPGRMILLERVREYDAPDFISHAFDPRLRSDGAGTNDAA